MHFSCAMDVRATATPEWCWRFGRRGRFTRKFLAWGFGTAFAATSLSAVAAAQSDGLVLEREGRVISLVPYGPNIVRVTMSTSKEGATAPPGYGIVASPAPAGMDA